MRGYAGVYALYHGKKLHYIGLARNLLRRIKHHLRDRHGRKWDTFLIFRIHKVGYLKDIETLMQHLADPPGNRVKGRVPRDADINRLLKDVLRRHQRKMGVFKKALHG